MEQVRENIMKEFMYQSSLELAQQTYDIIQRVSLASDITQHARQNLVRRLDHYQLRHTQLLENCVDLIQKEFVPILTQQSLSGEVLIRTKNS